MKTNGITHPHSSYHPASNGLAERVVQMFRQEIKRIQEGSLETRLSWFLFKYRITPHTTTRSSPAEVLLGRQPRLQLDLLHPDTDLKVEEIQARQSHGHGKHTTPERLRRIGNCVCKLQKLVGVSMWLERQANLLWFRIQVFNLLMGPRNNQERQSVRMIQLCQARRNMILSRHPAGQAGV